jgi:outer membrane lipoprotein-sorting protein
MKKIILTLFIIIGLTATAQTKRIVRKEERKEDKKAKILLDQVTAKIKQYNNIVIDFKYSLNNTKENVNQDTKGTVTMQGNLYVLNFMGVTKMFDGKKIYTINPEDEEISISKFDEKSENLVTPSKMLTFFNTGYKFDWDISQVIKGKKIQYVKLIPIGNKSKGKETLVGIDVAAKMIYTIIDIGKNGTKTTLTVNSFKTNTALPNNQFIFDPKKYPNYIINKLD